MVGRTMAGLRERLARICADLPGAEVSDPWGGGHEAWKVGDKMFASIGTMSEGVSVKCADIETSQMLKDAGIGVHAPYFHKSWIRLLPDSPDDELHHRVVASYDLVRSKLTKKAQAALPPRRIEEG